jgi:hypothetical protein
MAFEGERMQATGLVAGSDMRTKQFYLVKLSANNTVIPCAATTDKPYGVLQNKPNTGEPAAVVCVGLTKISGDANLAGGDSIGTSADGQAAAYTVADTTKYIVGQVQQDNTAAGGIVTAFICCPNSRVLA